MPEMLKVGGVYPGVERMTRQLRYQGTAEHPQATSGHHTSYGRWWIAAGVTDAQVERSGLPTPDAGLQSATLALDELGLDEVARGELTTVRGWAETAANRNGCMA